MSSKNSKNIKHDKVIVGLGSNLSHPSIGGPAQVIKEAIVQLGKNNLVLDTISSFYVTKPQGMAADTPDFVNVVAMTSDNRSMRELFLIMRFVEKTIGLNQLHRDAHGVPISRFLDIDFLDYHGCVCHESKDLELCLPHPRMHERLFVLIPLWEIFAQWQHPRFNLDKTKTIRRYSDQRVVKIDSV